MAGIDKTALIIDDEKVILLGISAMMRHEGFSVLTASNGSEGLELIRQSRSFRTASGLTKRENTIVKVPTLL